MIFRLVTAVALPTAILVGIAGLAAGDSGNATTSTAVVIPEAASTSCGAANKGSLHGGIILPAHGPGWVKPGPWLIRGRHYGTLGLVSLVERAAAGVNNTYPGSVLGVADMSGRRGGAITGHRSHQSGRDVDLLFYAIDHAGNYFPPDSYMPIYTDSGLATTAKAPKVNDRISPRFFDLKRNWELVRRLISDPIAPATRIFVSWRIRKWLLDYARASKEPLAIQRLAARTLAAPPRGRSAHNDHMHVRIGCDAGDIKNGACQEGIVRRRSGKKWYSKIACPAKPQRKRRKRRRSAPKS